MITDKIKALAAAKERVSQLEHSIASELNRELAGLPAKFGFSDVGSFIRAVAAAVGGKRGRPVKTTEHVERHKRAKITDAIRAKVKKLVQEGETGSRIAKALKISLPTVQNIKKALGLVRARRTPAKSAAAAEVRKKRVSSKKPSVHESKPGHVSDAATPVPST